MNKIVVVTKNKDTHFARRLTKEVGQGLVFFNPWSDLILPEAERYFVRTSGIYGNDLDLLILKNLPNTLLINPLACLENFRTKISQYLWLEERGFKVPPWIDLKTTSEINIERFFRLHPFAVVKPNIGQGGWGIECLNFSQFKSWWKKRKGIDENYLLQSKINDLIEFRLFFINSHPLERFYLKRSLRTGVAANFKQGGKAEIVHPTSQIELQLEQLIQLSGAFYGAIDFFADESSRECLIIDINMVPGVEQLEAVTGENILSKLISAKFFCQQS